MAELDMRITSANEREEKYKMKADSLDKEFQAKREKLHQRFHWVNTKMEEYEEKFNKKFDMNYSHLLMTRRTLSIAIFSRAYHPSTLVCQNSRKSTKTPRP